MHGDYPLCKEHWLRGMFLPRDDGSFHTRGWKPFYRLDDISPWQEIALRNWEDGE